MWQTYFQPTTIDEALDLLRDHAEQARIVAGGTDLIVELERGVRPTSIVIDISRLPELRYVREEADLVRIGGLTTHNDVLASSLCRERALPLVQACLEVGAPQIRTRATIAGNLVTASPANDTITPLMALDAELVLLSHAGERVVPLRDFYLGVRRTALRADELVREIRFAGLRPAQRGIFLKLGLRRAQAISVINVAVVLALNDGRVAAAQIALGCLAPTIVRAATAERYLAGKLLEPAVCEEAGRLARHDVRPIDDLRGSAAYRLDTLAALVAQALARIAAGTERDDLPEAPVLLDTAEPATAPGPATAVAWQEPRRTHYAGIRSVQRDVAAEDAAPVYGEILASAQVLVDQSLEHVSERSEEAAPSRAGISAATDRSRNVPAMRPQSQAPAQSQALTAVDTTINGRSYRLEHAARKTLLDALRAEAGLTGTKEGCAEGECGACTVWLNGQAVMACLVPAAQAHGAQITTIEGLGGESALHPLQEAFIDCGAVQCGYCIPGMLMAGAKLLEEHPHPALRQLQSAISGNICRCTGYRKILDALSRAAEVGA